MSLKLLAFASVIMLAQFAAADEASY